MYHNLSICLMFSWQPEFCYDKYQHICIENSNYTNSGSNGIWHAPSFFQTATLCSIFVIKHYTKTGRGWHFGWSILLTWECTHVLVHASICQNIPAHAVIRWCKPTHSGEIVSNRNILGLQECSQTENLHSLTTLYLSNTCKFILPESSKLYANKIWY